jgi:hypothetical protein
MSRARIVSLVWQVVSQTHCHRSEVVGSISFVHCRQHQLLQPWLFSLGRFSYTVVRVTMILPFTLLTITSISFRGHTEQLCDDMTLELQDFSLKVYLWQLNTCIYICTSKLFFWSNKSQLHLPNLLIDVRSCDVTWTDLQFEGVPVTSSTLLWFFELQLPPPTRQPTNQCSIMMSQLQRYSLKVYLWQLNTCIYICTSSNSTNCNYICQPTDRCSIMMLQLQSYSSKVYLWQSSTLLWFF